MFPKETKILVVDDMQTMRLIVKKNLAQLGFANVTDAVDGAAAWTLIQKAVEERQPYMLIVSDWTMPKMTGLDLLKNVRAHPEIGWTPFILLTAESDAELVKQALLAGVSNYITKPFTPDTLKQKLEAVYTRLVKK